MIGSSADVNRRVIGFAVWPNVFVVEVKGYVQKICSE